MSKNLARYLIRLDLGADGASFLKPTYTEKRHHAKMCAMGMGY